MKADRPAARPLFTYLLYRQPSTIVKTAMIIRRRSQAAGGSPQKNTRPTGRPYNAALPRQIHPICHKFRLSTKFTRDALTGRPLRYRIEAMKMNAGRCSQVADRKKTHGPRVAPTMRLCRVKFIPFVINSGYVQDSQRYALWASPTVSHRGDENNKQDAVRRWQTAKNHGLRPCA